MTKKKVLIVGLVGIVLFTISIFSQEIRLCPAYSYSSCSSFFDMIAESIFISIPLFLLSIITYKMRNETLQKWLKFTYVWVPITIILTFLSPEYGNSLLPIEKSSVSFVMSFLFLIISLIIIISKSISIRKKI